MNNNMIGNRNVYSKLPIVVFHINSISSIESEEFRENSSKCLCIWPELGQQMQTVMPLHRGTVLSQNK